MRTRGLEEAEAGADRLFGRGSPALVPGTHAVDEGQGFTHLLYVDARVERLQPVGVDVPDGVEVVGRLAVEHHADVDELLAVDARHAAEHDVLVGVHAAPAPADGSH